MQKSIKNVKPQTGIHKLHSAITDLLKGLIWGWMASGSEQSLFYN
jgi:hypothetical protein